MTSFAVMLVTIGINLSPDLSPESAQQYTTEHVRCGTNFLLTVMVVTIFVYAFVGRPSLPLLLASRLLLVPVIASIAYELIRLGARHSDNPVVARLLVPVLAAQYLTTREPDDSMMEVAITAFSAVRSRELSQTEPELLA